MIASVGFLEIERPEKCFSLLVDNQMIAIADELNVHGSLFLTNSWSAAAHALTGTDQFPGVVCRNSRSDGYQGLSARSFIQRKPVG